MAEPTELHPQLMKLGEFIFSLKHATFQGLSRSASYKWREVDVTDGQNLQFNGLGTEEMSLSGVIYPELLRQLDGGTPLKGLSSQDQQEADTQKALTQAHSPSSQPSNSDKLPDIFSVMQQMRAVAAQAKPLSMILGTGHLMGDWVITTIDENQTDFYPNGLPRKQEFSLKLKKVTYASLSNG